MESGHRWNMSSSLHSFRHLRADLLEVFLELSVILETEDKLDMFRLADNR